MPVWGWFLIAAVVLVVIVGLLLAWGAHSRRKTQRLREHYGAEYERTLEEAGGQRKAEAELLARERSRKKLDIVPLSLQAKEQYAQRWRMVQATFVDNPSSAVGEADALVTEVMRERGYPVDEFDQRAADVSVDHPDVVENYRAAHQIHLSHRDMSDEDRAAGTEEQRQAFVHYRALFDRLLVSDQDVTVDAPTEKSQEATA